MTKLIEATHKSRNAVRTFHVERAGWQGPECYGVNITRQESKYGGVSEDRFNCRECGAQWGRATNPIGALNHELGIK